MELLFRKYFWAVNLAVVIAAAYPTAKTVNAFIEEALSPVPDFNSMASGGVHPRSDIQKASLDMDSVARLTGMPKPTPPEKLEEARAEEERQQQTKFDEGAPPVKSGLRAKVVGAMKANQSQWSLATILDMTTNEIGIYMVGDKVLNADVLDVQWLDVREDGTIVKPGTTPPAPTPSPSAAAAPQLPAGHAVAMPGAALAARGGSLPGTPPGAAPHILPPPPRMQPLLGKSPVAPAESATPSDPNATHAKLCVIIKNNNRKEYLDAEGPDGSVPAAPVVAVAQPPPPGNNVLGQGIKEMGGNKYSVPRSEIDKTLSNLNDVAMQARIVPSFKDGQANGFKVFSIRPDSIYTKIGIQNGDVISRINGYEINSPDKALEVYAKLKEASRIEVELDRNGQRVLKTYNVE